METEQGKIVKIANGNATIQMEASSECQHCGAKHACGAFGGESLRHIQIPVTTEYKDVKEGDEVTLAFQPETRIFSAFLVFIVPIIMLIAGYFVGMNLFGSEGPAILSGFAGLILAFVIIWALNKMFAREEKLMPTILKINQVV